MRWDDTTTTTTTTAINKNFRDEARWLTFFVCQARVEIRNLLNQRAPNRYYCNMTFVPCPRPTRASI
jgi:hypothetical protein